MFDTMTITKVGGALCGALLAFLLLNWLAEIIYAPGGGHGEHAEAAYVIEVEGAEAAGAEEPAEAIDMVALVASADMAKGEKLFSKCKACHKVEAGANGTGPTLFGVVDRDIGSIEGYRYSSIMTELEGNWTPDALGEFLHKPKNFAPGTKMVFKGFADVEDRANIIAYLASNH